MCGLISIIARTRGGFTSKHLDIFEQMLILDTLRGKDSTGVMSIKSLGSVDVMKQAEQPYFMFQTDAWTSFRQRAVMNGRILAGHNRAATRGEVTNANAHPFYEKNIILMHNGTLSHGWESLTKEKVKVDSHAICHAFAESPHEEVLPKIDGAFALLWYDLEKERFYATRNEERPLNLITTENFYFLASESWMATIPAMREQIKVLDSHSIEPGDLLSWDLHGVMKTEKVKIAESYDNKNYQAWLARQGYASWEDDVSGEGFSATPNPVMAGMVHQIETKDCTPTGPTRSPACALTTTTKHGQNTKNTDSEETTLSKLENAQSNLKVEVVGLPKGREVLCKIVEVHSLPNGSIKWTGKLLEPGCEMLDASGFLPRSLPGNEWPAWMESWVTGKVGWVTKTVCGLVVNVRDPVKCEQTLTHMGKMIPSSLFYKALHTCECRDCQRRIFAWEKDWASIKVKGEFGQTKSGTPLNTIEMVCPDCIMKSLSGDIYARFSNSYYQRKKIFDEARAEGAKEGGTDPVQNREQVGGEPVGKNGSTIIHPGSPLIQ